MCRSGRTRGVSMLVGHAGVCELRDVSWGSSSWLCATSHDTGCVTLHTLKPMRHECECLRDWSRFLMMAAMVTYLMHSMVVWAVVTDNTSKLHCVIVLRKDVHPEHNWGWTHGKLLIPTLVCTSKGCIQMSHRYTHPFTGCSLPLSTFISLLLVVVVVDQ